MRLLFISIFIVIQLNGFSTPLGHNDLPPVDKTFSLTVQFPKYFDISKTDIMVQPYEVVCNNVPPSPVKKESFSERNTVTWKIDEPEAYWMNLPFIRDNGIVWYFVELGYNITINYDSVKPVFSGKGAAAWELVYKIHLLNDSIDKFPERKTLSRSRDVPKSLQDYLDWNHFLDKKGALFLKLIDQYRPQLSKLAYQGIKEWTLTSIEKRRLWKFNYLRGNSKFETKNQYGLTNQDLCNIYDSTMLGPYANWLLNELSNPAMPNPTYWWEMLKLELYRKKQRFFRNSENEPKVFGDRRENNFIKIYGLAKQKYTGLKREKIIGSAFYDPKGIFDAVGFTPAVDSLLKSYYAEPGFPEFKQQIKNIENKYREKTKADRYAAPFFLLDNKGNSVTNLQFLGKMLIVDFWFTGCVGCVQMAPALRKVADYFKNDTNVVFISISTDKDQKQWLGSIQKGTFTTGHGIELYTKGEGKEHEIISDYYVNSYPSLHIIDPKGKIVGFNYSEADPRKDSGKNMIELIKYQLAVSKDGPYVLYRSDSMAVYTIEKGGVVINNYLLQDVPRLEPITDQNIPFKIILKSKLDIEPSEFTQQAKLFVLSDIEGNFRAFRRLLINNGIIDEHFNWTFGTGHLVFAGDMFDRGAQVTECLWLIYSLEEKAKAAGGYIHFVLGNHELMILQGDTRYAVKKYHDNAAAINKPLKILYNEKSELGKWLRTKNFMEKIGDLLFIHGGVSPYVNEMALNIEQINTIGRPYYDSLSTEIKDKTARYLMSAPASPLWFRGYYGGDPRHNGSTSMIDSTLQKFDVKRIITGHTVVSDTISVHWDQKIINTDTRHAEGKSEALFIEGNKYYRVNQEGKRILLFIDDKIKR